MKLQQNSIINLYKEDIMRDLSHLISIKSVTSDRDECVRAMDFMVERARQMGLVAERPCELYCYAQLGNFDEYDAVLTHLDVVPAGDGWNTDPFTLTQQDGLLLGRGISDDKGAAIASLYCLKALKDSGITPKRSIRCIFGSAEETGMSDMEAYFSSHALPRAAFTPDSEFPVCNREKGILQLELYIKDADPDIAALKCGSAVNCVADSAFLRYLCDENKKKDLAQYIKNNNIACKLTFEQKGILITFLGKSAHAMEPENGINAIYTMLNTLVAMGCNSPVISLVESLKNDSRLKISDEPSGDLTMCIGTMSRENDIIKLTVDIRYPVTFEGEKIIKYIEAIVADFGAYIKILSHHKPIYFPEDAPLIQMLCNAYTEVTGKKADCYSTGGGTYARTLSGRGVAFGSVFPDAPDSRLHMSNENLRAEDYFAFVDICYAAMKKMAGEN